MGTARTPTAKVTKSCWAAQVTGARNQKLTPIAKPNPSAPDIGGSKR